MYKNCMIACLLALGVVHGMKIEKSDPFIKIKNLDVSKDIKVATKDKPPSLKQSGDGWFVRSWGALNRLLKSQPANEVKKFSVVKPWNIKTYNKKQDLEFIKSGKTLEDKEYLHRVALKIDKDSNLTENQRIYIKDVLKNFLPSEYEKNESLVLVRKEFYSNIVFPSTQLDSNVLKKINKEIDQLKKLYKGDLNAQSINEAFQNMDQLKDYLKQMDQKEEALEKMAKGIRSYAATNYDTHKEALKKRLKRASEKTKEEISDLLKKAHDFLHSYNVKNSIELINKKSNEYNELINKKINNIILETYFFNELLKCLEDEKIDIKDREKEIEEQKLNKKTTDQLKINIHCLNRLFGQCDKYKVSQDKIRLVGIIKDDYFGVINNSINQNIDTDTLISYVNNMIQIVKEIDARQTINIKKIKNNINDMLNIRKDFELLEQLFKEYYKKYKKNQISSFDDLHNDLNFILKNKLLKKEAFQYITGPLKAIENLKLSSSSIDISFIIRKVLTKSKIPNEQIDGVISNLDSQEYAGSYKELQEIKNYLETHNKISQDFLNNFKHRFKTILIGLMATEGIEKIQHIFNIK